MSNTRVIVSHYGGPDELQVIEEECPEPRDNEIRIKVLAAGVCLPDIMMREGVHPETPRVPFTPGWDLVGVIDRVGTNVGNFSPGQIVAALPIFGAYTKYICLPQQNVVPVPYELDAGEAVSLVLNYVTAYQMLHRSAKIQSGQRVLIHGAAGGVGTALLQLGKIAGIEMYGTCSSRDSSMVSELGGIPIDYKNQDFLKVIKQLTGDGVDAVFESIGGKNIWRSRQTLRRGGKVVAFGLTSSLSGGRLSGGRGGKRDRYSRLALWAWYVFLSRILPGRKRVVPYSIQWLMRLKPELFRQDLIALFDLLQQHKIKPIIARRFSLYHAKEAHELLGKGGVRGKIVLMCNGSEVES